jgi:hypothetical protein
MSIRIINNIKHPCCYWIQKVIIVPKVDTLGFVVQIMWSNRKGTLSLLHLMDGNRSGLRNVVYFKHRSENDECPTWCLYNEYTSVTVFRELHHAHSEHRNITILHVTPQSEEHLPAYRRNSYSLKVQEQIKQAKKQRACLQLKSSSYPEVAFAGNG